MSEESDRLIDAWLDGALSSEEAEQLNAWVKESPEYAARFADRTHLHSSLLEWGSAERLRSAQSKEKANEKPGSGILGLPPRAPQSGADLNVGSTPPGPVSSKSSRWRSFNQRLLPYAAVVTFVLVCTVFFGVGLATSDGHFWGAPGGRDQVDHQAQFIVELQKTLQELNVQLGLKSQLETVRSQGATAAAKVVSLEEEVARVNGEIASVYENFEGYRNDYWIAVRKNAVGEKIAHLTLPDGKVFEGVTIREVTPLGMSILHVAGVKRIPWHDLPNGLRDRFQFSEQGAVAFRAREQEIALAGQARKMPERQRTEDREKMKRKIAELRAGISSVQSRIAVEERKVADYRQTHADALARGNVSSHLASAQKAEARVDQLRNQIAQARARIAELEKMLGRSEAAPGQEVNERGTHDD